MLYQMDFFTSTRVGLPRVIKDALCDTQLPSVVPEHSDSSDGDGVNHPALFLNQRHSILTVAAEIYDATDMGAPSSTSIAALHSRISRAMDALPSWLTQPAFELTLESSPRTIMCRILVDILKQKATYLLHRHSFLTELEESYDESSVQLCIDSALVILEHQQTLNRESRPGGLLFRMRWKVFHSLNHEFLQATTMLCLALSKLDKGNGEAVNRTATGYRLNDVTRALRHSKDIWNETSHYSKEAHKAMQIISAALKDDYRSASKDTPKQIQVLLPISPNTASGSGNQTPSGFSHTLFDGLNYQQNTTFGSHTFSAEAHVAGTGNAWDAFMAESTESRWGS